MSCLAIFSIKMLIYAFVYCSDCWLTVKSLGQAITIGYDLKYSLTPSTPAFLIAAVRRVQRHTGLTHHFLFLTFGHSGAQS